MNLICLLVEVWILWDIGVNFLYSVSVLVEVIQAF